MGDAAFTAALAAGTNYAAPADTATVAPQAQAMSANTSGNKHLPKSPMLYAWITHIVQLAMPEPGYGNQDGGDADTKQREGLSEAPSGASDSLASIPTAYPVDAPSQTPLVVQNNQPLSDDPYHNPRPPPTNGQYPSHPPGYVPSPSGDPANPKINPTPWSPPNPPPPIATPQLPALIPLKLVSPLTLEIECHISTAFVTMVGSWQLACAAKGTKVDCLFALPVNHQGTVTEVEIDMGGGRMYATLVVPKDEASGYGAQGSKDAIPQDSSKYNPGLFRLTIPQVDAGSTLRLKVTWFQPMLFNQGKYGVRIPLELPPWVLPRGSPLNQALSVRCMINTGGNQPVGLGEFSHPMKQTYAAPGQIALVTDAAEAWPSGDFVASYQVWSQEILASLIVQYPQKELEKGKTAPDTRGTFCLSVSPPDPEHVQSFNRAVVFLLDRSGSMDGQPMLDAQQAIIQGLQLLRPEDRFTIIGFDHEQVAFSPHLQPATLEAVMAASAWVREVCRARGLTDILTPLNGAMQLLSTVTDAVPYVFLITDGAVDNEREICKSMQALVAAAGPRAPRISTFGIGTFCNYFFLKMLASIGRGLNDAVFNTDLLKEQMERMLVAASAPVLTNLVLRIEGQPEFEAYPDPIPDLFCGNPLVVSGKFAGEFPGALTLYGMQPSGQVYQTRVSAQSAPQIPLSKVFVKQQLDLLTARAWLARDDRLKQRVVDLSVAEGVPSEHTAMVGFETTPEKYGQLKADRLKGKKTNLKKYAVTKYAAIAVVGGIAIGFGSVAATMGNLPLGDLGGIGGDLGGLCGDIFCCDCGDICGSCGDLWEGIAGCFIGCFDGLGDTCASCFDCLGDGCDGIGDLCECLCSCLGDVLSSC